MASDGDHEAQASEAIDLTGVFAGAALRRGQAEEEARSAGVDAMGAALAHELNQPLTALLLYLQALKRGAARPESPMPPPARDLLDKSLREAERASEIVRRMRRFTSRSEPERRPFNLNDVAAESIEVAIAGHDRKVAIERMFSEDLPDFHGDSVQIGQVMVNLLKNAIEATRHRTRPRISVSTRRHLDQLYFHVADNGPGVDPRIAGRLFRAFETDKPQGLGLGLAISRMIAQNHGGELVLESGDSGKGAIFCLRLPVR
jgi:two-component system, LuxR family, sensor kinase FixL